MIHQGKSIGIAFIRVRSINHLTLVLRRCIPYREVRIASDVWVAGEGGS